MIVKVQSLPIVITYVILFNACQSSGPSKTDKPVLTSSDSLDMELEKSLSLFQALPTTSENPENLRTEEKVKLGHVLYYDTRLSENNSISCNSCHDLNMFGVDRKSFSPGHKGQLGGRNSPTTLNASLHFSQFWDGRAKDVEEQAGMPITNPDEMAIPNETYMEKRLKEAPMYKKLFSEAFPDDKNPVSYGNLKKAIGAFERELITPSRFDKYLNGDKSALSIDEKRGMLTFVKVGCASCHNGPLLGGNMFQKTGLFGSIEDYTKSKKQDMGRFEITKNESDKFVFKVPSLRNIAETYPYFHDGSVQDLGEAISIMGKIQLNKELSEQEISDIVLFMKSLTGEVPSFAKVKPAELNP